MMSFTTLRAVAAALPLSKVDTDKIVPARSTVFRTDCFKNGLLTITLDPRLFGLASSEGRL